MMKECPFCGVDKAVLHKCKKSHKYYVECENSHARTRKELLDTDAMRAWDMRREIPLSPITIAGVDEAIKELKELRDKLGDILPRIQMN